MNMSIHGLKELHERYNNHCRSKISLLKLMRDISREAYEKGLKDSNPKDNKEFEIERLLRENVVLIGKLNEYRNEIVPSLIEALCER